MTGQADKSVAKKLAEGRYSEFDMKRKVVEAVAADEVDFPEIQRLSKRVGGGK
jgi:hypothetical protein